MWNNILFLKALTELNPCADRRHSRLDIMICIRIDKPGLNMPFRLLLHLNDRRQVGTK